MQLRWVRTLDPDFMEAYLLLPDLSLSLHGHCLPYLMSPDTLPHAHGTPAIDPPLPGPPKFPRPASATSECGCYIAFEEDSINSPHVRSINLLALRTFGLDGAVTTVRANFVVAGILLV